MPETMRESNEPEPPVTVMPEELIVVVEVANAKTNRKEVKTERVTESSVLFLKLFLVII